MTNHLIIRISGANHLQEKLWYNCFQIPFKENFCKYPTNWGKMSYKGASPFHVFQIIQANVMQCITNH